MVQTLPPQCAYYPLGNSVLSFNVSVIDGASNTVVATVAVGSGRVDVDVNPSTNRGATAAGGLSVHP